MTREQAIEVLTAHGFYSDLRDASKEQFTRACKEGKVEAVKAFIALGMELEHHDDISLETPLIRAAEGAHIDVIDVLVDAGANLENRDSPGDTALMTAVNWGHEEVVRHLLKRGADADAMDNHKWTPLTKSIKNGKDEFMEILLEGGARPDFGAETNDAATQYAIYQENANVLKRCLAAGGDPNLADASGNTLLHLAVQRGKRKLTEILCKAGADPNIQNKYGWSAWDNAIFAEETSLAKLLAKKKAQTRVLDDVIAFFKAADSGDTEGIQTYLDAGGDINAVDPFGKTALMKAASEGHSAVLRQLLEQGIDLHAVDKDGDNALYFAALSDHTEAGKILTKAGANPNKQDAKGERSEALYQAFSNSNVPLFKLLVEAGARIDDLGEWSTTFVYGEYEFRKRDEIIRYLGARGGDVNPKDQFGEPVLCAFAHKGDLKMCRTLIEAGADINDSDGSQRTALHRACDQYNNEDEKYAELAHYLLTQGADFSLLNCYDNSAMHDALTNKNPPCVRALQNFFQELFTTAKEECGVSDDTLDEAFFAHFVKTQNYETLLEWVRQGEHEIVEGLLKAGLTPDFGKPHADHPLELATEQDDVEMVRLLLAYGANPNAPQSYGLTPFMDAVSKQNTTIVKMMLEAGGDPDQLSSWGNGAIHRAAGEGNVELLELLVEAGGSLNRDPVGWSPVIRAAQSNHLEAIAWMVAHGADLNVRTEYGPNALTYAIEGDHEETALFLIEKGIDLDVPDSDGATPLIHAVKKGNRELIQTLRNAGANPYHRDNNDQSAVDYAEYREELADLFADLASNNNTTTREAVDADCPLNELLRAIYNRNADTFRNALNNGASANSTNYRGDTALMLAILHEQEEMAHELVEQGADLEATNAKGDSAWTYGVVSGNEHWKTWLEEKGLKISMDALNQQASYMMRRDDYQKAYNAGDIAKIAKIFEDKDIDINAINAYSRPLHNAIEADDFPMTRTLLQLGADPTLQSAYGQNAIEIAQDVDNHKILALFDEQNLPN